MHVRICPNCGEEYRPEIAVCADCGALLEDHYPESETQLPIEVATRPGLEVQADLVRLASASRALELEPLAKRLGIAGIPYLVRAGFQAFSLLVRSDDAENALKAVTDLLPEQPVPMEERLDSDGRYLSCPACGVGLDASVTSCPECGLALAQTNPGELGEPEAEG